MPALAPAVLQSFAEALFVAGQVPADEARQTAHSLVLANLSGHDSHGVIRIPQYLAAINDGRLKPGAPLTIEREAGAVLVADAGWGLGQVQAHRLLAQLMPKARAAGLAAGTLRQCGHIGRLGEFAETVVAQGLCFLATVNNHGFGRGMAPPGGIEARIGTNPLCLGAPTHGEPAILDIGVTVVAEGKVRVLFNKKQLAPEGWLIDPQGKPTTDPGVLYREPRGSILPLGGPQAYKGFGIGLLLDMFVGGFSGARCSHPSAPNLSANAVFFLVLDPEAFYGAAHFLRETTAVAEAVRACPRAAGITEITLPGDPERRERQRRASQVTLDDGTWSQLVKLAQGLGVDVPAT